MSGVDKILLRTIAISQALVGLLGLLMTPVLFNYGGASANPIGFPLYVFTWAIGIASAASLFSGRLWARLFALLWNAPICVALAYASRDRTFRSSDAALALLAASILATGYLLGTTSMALAATYRRSSNRVGD